MTLEVYVRGAMSALEGTIVQEVMSEAADQAELVVALLRRNLVKVAELVAGVPVIHLPLRAPRPLPGRAQAGAGALELERLGPCPWRPGTEWARQAALYQPGMSVEAWMARGGTQRVLREGRKAGFWRIKEQV